MFKKNLFSLLVCLLALPTVFWAQLPAIYKDGFTPPPYMVWSGWGGFKSAQSFSTNANSPYQGANHYQVTYNGYSVFRINLDDFYKKPRLNFTPYTILRIAYRGLDSKDKLEIRLRDMRADLSSGTIIYEQESNAIRIGDPTPNYQIVEIPLSLLTEGTFVNANAISEIRFDINSLSSITDKTLYIDNVELDYLPSPTTTTTATTARYNSLKKGFDASNWLESSWKLADNYVSGIVNGYNSATAPYPVATEFTRETFRALKNAGFDHVRLPVIFEHLADQITYNFKGDAAANKALASVKDAITWAKEFEMKIIIDNHNNMNDKEDYPLINPISENLTNFNYNNTTKINFIKGVWKKIIGLYKNESVDNVLFEISNEPHGVSNNNWWALCNDIIQTIRPDEAGNTHTFIVGANDYSSINGLMTFKPILDNNIIYTFHCYDPFDFTHQGLHFPPKTPYPSPISYSSLTDRENLQKGFNLADKWSKIYNAPIYMGEFGVSTKTNSTARCTWLKDMTDMASAKNISWAYWDVKNWDNAFGIFQNPSNLSDHSITQGNLLSCFKSNMGLYPCDAPSNLVVSNNATNNLTLTWNPISNSGNYTIEYKKLGDATWSKWATNSTSNTAAFTSNIPFLANTIYSIRITCVCSLTGNTLYSNEITTNILLPIGDCNPPAFLSPISITSTGATLRWTDPSTATNKSYEIACYPVLSDDNPINFTATSGARMLAATGLASNTKYNALIRKVCTDANGGKSYSNQILVTFTTGAGPACPAPTALFAPPTAITASSIVLIWTAATSGVTYTTQYKVDGTSVWTNQTPVSGTSTSITGLQANTCYNIRIKEACGTSVSYSNTITVKTPFVAPTVTISSPTLTTANVNWNSVNNATKYRVEYATTTSGSSWNVAGTVTANPAITANTLNLTGLLSQTAYNVRVKTIYNTCNPVGLDSVYSPIVPFSTSACTASSNLVATNITTTSSALTWKLGTSTTNTIEYKLQSSATWLAFASNISGTTYSMTALTPNTCYTVRLKSVCGSTILYSNEIVVGTFACAAPIVSVGKSMITANSALVSWTAVAGAKSYLVEYKLSTSTVWKALTPITATTGTTVTANLPTLAAGTIYQVRVSTNCTTCNPNDWSNYTSAPFTFTTLPSVLCPAPTNLTYLTGRTTIALSWTPVIGATAYIVDYKVMGAGIFSSVNSANASYNLSVPTPQTTAYVIRIRAVCGETTSLPSIEINTMGVIFALKSNGSNSSQQGRAVAINSMEIAPNPATDKFNVFFALKELSTIDLELTDALGKVLRSEKLSLKEGQYEIDIRQLPVGIYFVRARINETELLVKKVIK